MASCRRKLLSGGLDNTSASSSTLAFYPFTWVTPLIHPRLLFFVLIGLIVRLALSGCHCLFCVCQVLCFSSSSTFPPVFSSEVFPTKSLRLRFAGKHAKRTSVPQEEFIWTTKKMSVDLAVREQSRIRPVVFVWCVCCLPWQTLGSRANDLKVMQPYKSTAWWVAALKHVDTLCVQLQLLGPLPSALSPY